MRLFLAMIVALFVAPTFATPSIADSEDSIGVTVLRIEGKGAYVSWQPGPAVVIYEIYRGPSLDEMRLIATTPNVAFSDYAPYNGDAWYQIVGYPADGPIESGPVRGKCLMVRGATGVSVTVANCMPGRLPWP